MRNRMMKLIATAGIAALALTGCAADADGPEAGANGAANTGDDDASLKIAVFNGWDEGIAVSELWKAVLEEQGYDVELEYADPAVVYTGLAGGDYDVTLDTWLPITHEEYVATYGDDIVDLGAWNDEASLTIAVNEDAPITSLEELADHADEFGGSIYGIEPGAGLTKVTQEAVVPGYGLEGMELVISSTPAMLAELQKRTDAGENVVVTLWRPHWAYDAFPIRDLEDPQGALGAAESIHSYGKGDIEETHPQVAAWLKEFKMSSDLLYSLENAMFNEYDGDDYGPVVAEWMDENRDFVDGLTQ